MSFQNERPLLILLYITILHLLKWKVRHLYSRVFSLRHLYNRVLHQFEGKPIFLLERQMRVFIYVSRVCKLYARFSEIVVTCTSSVSAVQFMPFPFHAILDLTVQGYHALSVSSGAVKEHAPSVSNTASRKPMLSTARDSFLKNSPPVASGVLSKAPLSSPKKKCANTSQ